jgi:hypothetical protein
VNAILLLIKEELQTNAGELRETTYAWQWVKNSKFGMNESLGYFDYTLDGNCHVWSSNLGKKKIQTNPDMLTEWETTNRQLIDKISNDLEQNHALLKEIQDIEHTHQEYFRYILDRILNVLTHLPQNQKTTVNAWNEVKKKYTVPQTDSNIIVGNPQVKLSVLLERITKLNGM